MAPRFIVSRAELGTMIIEPFSLRPSKSMFMPRRCMATGLRLVLLGGLGEFLGDLRLGGAQDDSRLSLPLGLGLLGHRGFQVFGDDDVADLDRLDADAPGLVFSSRISRRRLPSSPRWVSMSASSCVPMMSRRAVWADRTIAR